jgi:spermidine/putrescine-binding protein
LPSGTSGAWLDAINKGYFKVGSVFFRNVSKTGDRTWTGQESEVQIYTSNPNVAIGTTWSETFTFSLSADGQSFQIFKSGNSTPYQTWTRTTTYSLDGVWKMGGWIVTINGSTGVVTQLPSGTSGAWLDAINKGYFKVGSVFFRNLSKTGDRTWTGQESEVQIYTSNPNVAVGTAWSETFSFSLSADGQSFQIFKSGNSTPYQTWTRQ